MLSWAGSYSHFNFFFSFTTKSGLLDIITKRVILMWFLSMKFLSNLIHRILALLTPSKLGSFFFSFTFLFFSSNNHQGFLVPSFQGKWQWISKLSWLSSWDLSASSELSYLGGLPVHRLQSATPALHAEAGNTCRQQRHKGVLAACALRPAQSSFHISYFKLRCLFKLELSLLPPQPFVLFSF